ncbi:ABC transporter permease [Tomitella cavernea]|uniref:ABC transporter permease subunit n=1 Tax=Tomitella cavernea TaxID=1387982 RepID=A0ABP9C3N8_9ACTN|nr:ABC transporter permease subunit [Tomitella cavernea]
MTSTTHESGVDVSASRKERALGWWSVVGVLMQLELRQRLRTTRWKATLGIAFVVLAVAVFGSMYIAMISGGASYRDWARNLYAIVMAAELFFGIILAPTLTATAINGDRKDATLALVQATPISNRQLVVGKLAGNWVSCLALVAISSPFLIWGMIAAPYGIAIGLLGVVVLCLLFACYGGIGLGFSALTARPAGSAVLTQATVFFLILGLPALFGLFYTTTSQEHQVVRGKYAYPARSSEPGISPTKEPVCHDVEQTETFYHTEHIWWLLAPNPFLILPDVVAEHDNPVSNNNSWIAGQRPTDPTIMTPISQMLSRARAGPYINAPRCHESMARYTTDPTDYRTFYQAQNAHAKSRVGDSWPVGLLVNAVFGFIGVFVAARRLRVPAGKLPKGTRIA